MDQFYSQQWPLLPNQVRSQLMADGFSPARHRNIFSVSLGKTYRYDADNRLTNWNDVVKFNNLTFPVETITYTYDQNGNRITKQKVITGREATPQHTSYAYDFENRLNKLGYVNIPGITGPQTDNFIYSGDGLRVQAVRNNVTADYLYDGSNVLVERDSSGNNTKTYTRGLDTGGGIGSIIAQNYTNNSTAVTQYYDYNDLGSTSEVTTSTGTTVASYNYDAFGNLLAPQGSGDTNRYLFSTKEFDARSGLYYFGARYYDPEIGRWLTQDPLGFADGINLYAYVHNNPVNLVDLFGFCSSEPGLQDSLLGEVGIIGLALTGAETVADVIAAAKIQNVLDSIENNNGAPPQGYKGGGVWRNDGSDGSQVLPQIDDNGNPVTYQEYDINPSQPGNRGPERVVVGSDGKAYYTDNHYKTFRQVK